MILPKPQAIRPVLSLVWLLAASAVAGIAMLLLTAAHAGDEAPAASRVRWSAEERAVLASLSLKRLPAAPADPSNAAERHPGAIDLGRRLFEDPRLSRNGAVSCASCHDPARQFQDGLPMSRGVGVGTRRAMPITGAGHATWLFWDGRKDSLWSQALGPLEDAVEHGTHRPQVAQRVAQDYRREYEAVFGALPLLQGLPAESGPKGSPAAQAAWQAIEPRRRAEVSRVFANVGKAIAAFEKSLPVAPTRLDRYMG